MANVIFDILRDRRIILLAVVIIGALALTYFHGLKFGIDFSGGIRIPVLLEKAVDGTTMDEMVRTIGVRAAAFGLTEVKVRAIGSDEIYVEVPASDPKLVSDIEELLSKQGVFTGVVDGKSALRGDDIFTGTIVSRPSQSIQSGADWEVDFSVTKDGAERFSSAAKGKANYPIYLFLDRPSDSIMLISKEDLKHDLLTYRGGALSDDEVRRIAENALKLEDDNITLYLLGDANVSSLEPKTNRTRAIISKNTTADVKSALKEKGFILLEKEEAEMMPKFSINSAQPSMSSIDKWEAVGLLSAPRLSAGVTEGIPNYGYSITGAAEGEGTEKTLNAQKDAKEIESILKGGALPVQISIGSTTIIPAPLGEQFLYMSAVGALIALCAVGALVAIRYRTLKAVVPIIIISICEAIILVSVVGFFTIDLGAMAGIIGSMGVSVDAQIVITDELLKSGEAKVKLKKAFSIVITTATVAIVAMLPLLLFSGLVAIIGFATSTILGAFLGIAVSRPAYGAIAEKIFKEEEKAEPQHPRAQK
jgi:preprotein translocase subunit SecD